MTEQRHILTVIDHGPVERAIAECDRRLQHNVAAYGKAWTGETDDTRFIVAPLADAYRGAVDLLREYLRLRADGRYEDDPAWETLDDAARTITTETQPRTQSHRAPSEDTCHTPPR